MPGRLELSIDLQKALAFVGLLAEKLEDDKVTYADAKKSVAEAAEYLRRLRESLEEQSEFSPDDTAALDKVYETELNVEDIRLVPDFGE